MRFDFDLNALRVGRITNGYLLLNRSRIGSLLLAIFESIMVIIWYSVLNTHDEVNKWVYLLFLIAPLMVLGKPIYLNLLAAFTGERYKFSKNSQTIRKNGKRWLNFDDIDYVQIRIFYDHDDEQESYRLALVCTNKRKYFLDESKNYNQIFHVADQIAFVTDVELIKKKDY